MRVSVVVGMQWGDEGKGKIVDLLAGSYDYIVRFNGGDNAGHTIKFGEKKFGLHLIPSGVFYPEKTKVIGNGVVINPETLEKEITDVESAGYRLDKLFISDRAHIIMGWHKTLDGIRDEKNQIGTTKKGIGPAYADKAMRSDALRVCDLLLPDEKLRQKLGQIAESKTTSLRPYAKVEYSQNYEAIYKQLLGFRERIKGRVTDVASMLNMAVAGNQRILLEGAQGALLDIDHGTYPYVTSSNTLSGAASCGSGIPPTRIDSVIGITKAYTTRVCSGPFPTELQDEIGEKIRQVGGEFGTTTGRPRRCGWLDMVALKYSAMLNGTTHLVMTKLDVLDGVDKVKVCIAYEIDGRETTAFPADVESLARAKPVYKTFKGWKITAEDWAAAKQNKAIPIQCKQYVNYVKRELKAKVLMLSYGPGREQTVLF